MFELPRCSKSHKTPTGKQKRNNKEEKELTDEEYAALDQQMMTDFWHPMKWYCVDCHHHFPATKDQRTCPQGHLNPRRVCDRCGKMGPASSILCHQKTCVGRSHLVRGTAPVQARRCSSLILYVFVASMPNPGYNECYTDISSRSEGVV